MSPPGRQDRPTPARPRRPRRGGRLLLGRRRFRISPRRGGPRSRRPRCRPDRGLPQPRPGRGRRRPPVGVRSRGAPPAGGHGRGRRPALRGQSRQPLLLLQDRGLRGGRCAKRRGSGSPTSWTASTSTTAATFAPGGQAAKERGVRSPLDEAGFTKADVRAAARRVGLPVWDKPALACLSSRFPYGTAITPERLTRVAACERVLRERGFRVCRVALLRSASPHRGGPTGGRALRRRGAPRRRHRPLPSGRLRRGRGRPRGLPPGRR